MHVETYEATELTTGEPVEFEDGAAELIAELGLEGQAALLQEKEGGDSVVTVRNPYRQMTEEEFRVYGTLFQGRTRLHAYDAAPVPLRVLQVAAHASTVPGFKHLEVWHPKAGVLDTDPLLVAIAEDPKHSWIQTHWLLARWGETLLPFEELKEKAAGILARDVRAQLERMRTWAAGALETAEADIASFLDGRGRHPLASAPDLRQ